MTAQRSIAVDSTTAPPRVGWLRATVARVTAWWATCRDYYVAAATYEELSRLSDAELARRGLDRATLARDVCEQGRRDACR